MGTHKNHDGPTYAEREKLKSDSWEAYRAGGTIAEKVAAIEGVMKAHYDRSREAYRGKHPEFDIYAKHWIHALQDKIDKDTLQALIEKYGEAQQPMIQRGFSYWPTPTRRRGRD